MATSVLLSLYATPDPLSFGQHSPLSGSNACWLQRVTTAWDEGTVTWNTQPASTEEHEVELPMSTDPLENYVDIDVTQLVQDMLADPANSHGFELRLQEEEHYRRLVFASSDDPDVARWPQLQVCYTLTTGMADIPAEPTGVVLFPDPANDLLHLSGPTGEVYILDATGRQVARMLIPTATATIDVSGYAPGLYHVHGMGGSMSASFLVQH